MDGDVSYFVLLLTMEGKIASRDTLQRCVHGWCAIAKTLSSKQTNLAFVANQPLK